MDKPKRAAAWLTRGAAVSHTLTQAFVTRDPRKSDCREWRYSSFGICREQQLVWEAARDRGRRPSSHFTQALLCRTSLALTLPLPPARRPCLRHHIGRVGWISCHVPELSPGRSGACVRGQHAAPRPLARKHVRRRQRPLDVFSTAARVTARPRAELFKGQRRRPHASSRQDCGSHCALHDLRGHVC